jgi:CRISPR system Cascade subunit CasC
MFGGTQRIRVSSQSLKRAWRTSDTFKAAVEAHLGARTQRLGERVKTALLKGGIKEKLADGHARDIAGVFGKIKKTGVLIEQLAHISVEDLRRVDALVTRIVDGHTPEEADLTALLGPNETTVDVALFGRMLAKKPEHNTDAACQVSHALSVHRTTLEDDFFTAVDDLKPRDEDVGAGMLGTTEFAASVLYTYVCINRSLLMENLGNNKELVDRTLAALVETAATVSPTGKQNSYASRARASYLLAECGSQQPRSLAAAFLKDVDGRDYLEEAIQRLEQTRENMNNVYGSCSEGHELYNAQTGQGSLAQVMAFVTASPSA